MAEAKRLGLRTIFTGLNVGLLVLFGAAVALLTHGLLRGVLERRVDQRGVTMVQLLAHAAGADLSGGGGTQSLQATLDVLLGQDDVLFATVAGPDGNVVAQAMRQGADPATIRALLATAADASGRVTLPGAGGAAYRATVVYRQPAAVVLIPAPADQAQPAAPGQPQQVQVQAPAPGPEQRGTAMVALSSGSVDTDLRRGIQRILLATLVAAIIAALVAFVFTGWVMRPLSQMVDHAVAVSRGDYDRIGEVHSRTKEVGALADAFATMRMSLAMVANQARRIAAGDLSQRVSGAGQLGDAFNTMVESLSRLVGQIQTASMQMAGSSSAILDASRQAERGSAEQATSINQTTTTMDELLSASKQIATSADSVVKIAERTLGAAKAGEDAVRQSISGMEEIASNNRQTAERILELSERNQQIGNIVDLIDEIADKSDLLALNAAIEGAKAGEAGKGFAVVATEMRALAENVVESTKEIKALITEIQKASNASVLATEGQMKATERGTDIALRTGGQLREILQMVVETTEAAKRISLATQQQRTGTEQVVQSMAEIARIAKTNVSGAGRTTAATDELARLAEDLQEAASQFRLGVPT